MPLYCDLHAMGEQGHLPFSPFLLQKRVLVCPANKQCEKGKCRTAVVFVIWNGVVLLPGARIPLGNRKAPYQNSMGLYDMRMFLLCRLVRLLDAQQAGTHVVKAMTTAFVYVPFASSTIQTIASSPRTEIVYNSKWTF